MYIIIIKIYFYYTIVLKFYFAKFLSLPLLATLINIHFQAISANLRNFVLHTQALLHLVVIFYNFLN